MQMASRGTSLAMSSSASSSPIALDQNASAARKSVQYRVCLPCADESYGMGTDSLLAILLIMLNNRRETRFTGPSQGTPSARCSDRRPIRTYDASEDGRAIGCCTRRVLPAVLTAALAGGVAGRIAEIRATAHIVARRGTAWPRRRLRKRLRLGHVRGTFRPPVAMVLIDTAPARILSTRPTRRVYALRTSRSRSNTRWAPDRTRSHGDSRIGHPPAAAPCTQHHPGKQRRRPAPRSLALSTTTSLFLNEELLLGPGRLLVAVGDLRILVTLPARTAAVRHAHST